MTPPMTPTRVMINTAAVLAVIGLAWLLIQVRSIVLLLILGILLAAAIDPLVTQLRHRGFTRGQGILAIYAGILTLLGLGLYLVAPPLIAQGTDLINDIPTILSDLRVEALESQNQFVRTAGVRTFDNAIRTYARLQQSPPVAPDTAFGFLTSVVGVLFTTITVMIVAFYWMTEKAIIKRVLLGLFPLSNRDRAHALWDEIEAKLGGWTRGQLTLMVVIGILSGIAYSPLALDLRFWLPIAIWAGITELIPFIGPVLGGAVAVLVALADSWEKAVMVVVFVVLLQQLEGAVLVPRVMRNAVGMTPLTVILAVLIGNVLNGPLGAVLAIPVGAAVQVIVQDLLGGRRDDAD
ncbi:MAG: AI-2E family transporter, partial [Chloroflexota bacterium]|nr:AI-2E family transporter [Chloroflexota bacterium]